MKQRSVHKPTEQKPTEKERFEKWLLDGKNPAERIRNLERAARAPYDTDAKVSVLSKLPVLPRSQAAFLSMEALRDMALDGSEHAREAFEKAAEAWLNSHPRDGVDSQILSGIFLIIDAASRLDSPRLKKIVEDAAIRCPVVRSQLYFWEHTLGMLPCVV